MTTNDERVLVTSFKSTSKQRAHELVLSWGAEGPMDECPLYRAHRLLDEESVKKAGFQCIFERYLGSGSSCLAALSEDDSDFLGQLRDRIWAGLQKGAFGLTGVIKRDLVDGDAKRKSFAAEWVKAVALNWEDDSASLNGEVIALNIEIKRTAPVTRRPSSNGHVNTRQWIADFLKRDSAAPNRDVAWKAFQADHPGCTDRKGFRREYRRQTGRGRGRPS